MHKFIEGFDYGMNVIVGGVLHQKARIILLQFRIVRFEAYLKSEKLVHTAIRTVFGLAIRIVRFEIAVNRWRFESLRTRTALQDI